MTRSGYGSHIRSWLFFLLTLTAAAMAQSGVLKGRVTDPQGNATPDASVRLVSQSDGRVLGQAITGADGKFELILDASGKFDIKVEAEGFKPVSCTVAVGPNPTLEITLRLTELQLDWRASRSRPTSTRPTSSLLTQEKKSSSAKICWMRTQREPTDGISRTPGRVYALQHQSHLRLD